VSAPRTVTVQTLVDGPVTLPEPSWCRGEHPAVERPADIRHEGEELSAIADTACHGRIPFLNAFLLQYPLAENTSRAVTVAVQIEGEHHEFDPVGLGDLAATITAHALYGLLPLRRQLRALLDEES
jgi:hypothetical protein